MIPTDKGLAVYDIVKDKQIANAEMTGQWELALAKIENGEQQAETFSKNIREYTGQICKEMLRCGISTIREENLIACPICKKETVRIYPKIAKCTDKECDFKSSHPPLIRPSSNVKIRHLTIQKQNNPTHASLTIKQNTISLANSETKFYLCPTHDKSINTHIIIKPHLTYKNFLFNWEISACSRSVRN